MKSLARAALVITLVIAPSGPRARGGDRRGVRRALTDMETTNGRAAAIRHAHHLGGRVGGHQAMIAGGRPITDLARQVAAARASLDALLGQLMLIKLDLCPGGDYGRPTVDRLVRIAIGRRPGRSIAPQLPARAPR